VLNKTELKGPTVTELWAVVIYRQDEPTGTYLYKTRENADRRFLGLQDTLLGPRTRMFRVALDWQEQ
jgi:hypothetical protein